MDFINEASGAVAVAAADIGVWEAAHLEKVFVPFYSSADIRISSSKAAVVDTNIFPAGFNNLSPDFRDRLGLLIRDAISRKYPGADKLLVIPEIHTRNPHYWENVKTLEEVLRARGFEVKVGFVDDAIERDVLSAAASGGGTVEVVKAARDGAKISAGGFVPDAVLLNNDFSDDCPTILRDIEQPVLPPVEIGWHSRRKDVHFEFYNSLAREAAAVCGIDPEIISIETRLIENVDFDEPQDRERIARAADEMAAGPANGEPLLFVKSNNGTFGMAVVAVSGGDGIRNLNAENRKKMRAGKSKNPSRQIVIQEGIETVLRTDDGHPAEPVLYMVETEVAGAFYRTNSKKSETQNLNSSGMEFRQFPNGVKEFGKIPELLSLCAKIAVIAAGYEIEKVMLEGGCE
ncbi:glutamate--cysteine ligase [Candidatus Mycalebacterium sp.]